jgi:tetratricopeptide (TPR) repeat protein
MESGVAHPALPESAPANGSPVNGSHEAANGAGYTTHQLPAETNGTSHPSVTSENHDAITVLLGKGQTLLRLDKPDAAIMCFDEVLAIDAKNTDALVKKGAALERLQKLDEAIDCFDRAIAADSAMTMAYLYKGGVFNRMERYAEALECYERALRTQEKNRSANVIIE